MASMYCSSLSEYFWGFLLPWLFLRSFFSSAWHLSRASPLLLCSVWYFFSAALRYLESSSTFCSSCVSSSLWKDSSMSSSWFWICLCTSAIWKRTSPSSLEPWLSLASSPIFTRASK